jgi:hypothetical protein
MAMQLMERMKRFMSNAERSGLVGQLEADAASRDAAHRDGLVGERKRVIAEFDQLQRVADEHDAAAQQRVVAAVEQLKAAKRAYGDTQRAALTLSFQRDRQVRGIEAQLAVAAPPALRALQLTIEHLIENVRSVNMMSLGERSWLSGRWIPFDNGSQKRKAFLELLTAARFRTDHAMRTLSSEECNTFVREELRLIAESTPEYAPASDRVFRGAVKSLEA